MLVARARNTNYEFFDLHKLYTSVEVSKKHDVCEEAQRFWISRSPTLVKPFWMQSQIFVVLLQYEDLWKKNGANSANFSARNRYESCCCCCCTLEPGFNSKNK